MAENGHSLWVGKSPTDMQHGSDGAVKKANFDIKTSSPRVPLIKKANFKISENRRASYDRKGELYSRYSYPGEQE